MFPLSFWYHSIMLVLDGRGALHRQAYRALREMILDARLQPGQRLPSSRTLAEDTGLSRNTVLQALEQLQAEGYVETRRGAGTFVASSLPKRPTERRRPTRRTARLSRTGRRMLADRRLTWNRTPESVPYDFRYGEPLYDPALLQVWSRRVGRRVRRLGTRQLGYQSPAGIDELREALASYLARSRGLVCDPEQVVVVSGSQQAMDLIVRVTVDPGDTAVLEDPHYPGARLVLRAVGARTVFCPVDADGLLPERLRRIERARICVVTPAHQFPSGAVLPLARRLELLAWARTADSLIVEDDYDGEFRYDANPIRCLQALDESDRVIYVGTASKVLFPSLRLGWLVIPRSLVAAVSDAKAILDTGAPALEQLALADLVASGDLERHVRRTRRRLATRRAALLSAFDRQLGDRVEIRGAAAGLHVLARIHDVPRSGFRTLRAECRQRGVGVYSAAPFYSRPPDTVELLIGYSGVDDGRIEEGIRQLRLAIDAVHR